MAHRNYYNNEGLQVPSVTEIVALLQKPGLDLWANWMGLVRRIDVSEYVEQKANYGTYCHDLFEQFFMGFLSHEALDHNFVTDRQFWSILAKFQFIKEQFRKYQIEVINMEMGLDGKRYGGTLDMLTVSKTLNRVILLDLKTSKSIYQSHLLQLGGYSSLLEEVHNISVTDVGVILLSKPMGDDLINVIPREKNKHNEKIFEKLTDIYYLQKQEGENKNEIEENH